MSIQRLFTLFLMAFSWSAWSYVPPYSMIMARTADSHGHGAVVIDQDVTYHSPTGDEIVHETWTVLDENRMRLSFQGAGPLKDSVVGGFVYENHTRLGKDGGQTRSRKLGDGWLEPFFFFRSSKSVRTRLVQMNIAPPESLRDRPPLKSDGPPDYEPEPYVHLARENGQVTWEISKSPDSRDQPSLWIEQDQFVVTKVRPEAQISVEAEDYAKFDGGLYFPRVRTYRWGDKFVTARIRSIRTVTNPKIKDFSSVTGLAPVQLSGSDSFKDFYLRFR